MSGNKILTEDQEKAIIAIQSYLAKKDQDNQERKMLKKVIEKMLSGEIEFAEYQAAVGPAYLGGRYKYVSSKDNTTEVTYLVGVKDNKFFIGTVNGEVFAELNETDKAEAIKKFNERFNPKKTALSNVATMLYRAPSAATGRKKSAAVLPSDEEGSVDSIELPPSASDSGVLAASNSADKSEDLVVETSDSRLKPLDISGQPSVLGSSEKGEVDAGNGGGGSQPSQESSLGQGLDSGLGGTSGLGPVRFRVEEAEFSSSDDEDEREKGSGGNGSLPTTTDTVNRSANRTNLFPTHDFNQADSGVDTWKAMDEYCSARSGESRYKEVLQYALDNKSKFQPFYVKHNDGSELTGATYKNKKGKDIFIGLEKKRDSSANDFRIGELDNGEIGNKLVMVTDFNEHFKVLSGVTLDRSGSSRTLHSVAPETSKRSTSSPFLTKESLQRRQRVPTRGEQEDVDRISKLKKRIETLLGEEETIMIGDIAFDREGEFLRFKIEDHKFLMSEEEIIEEDFQVEEYALAKVRACVDNICSFIEKRMPERDVEDDDFYEDEDISQGNQIHQAGSGNKHDRLDLPNPNQKPTRTPKQRGGQPSSSPSQPEAYYFIGERIELSSYEKGREVVLKQRGSQLIKSLVDQGENKEAVRNNIVANAIVVAADKNGLTPRQAIAIIEFSIDQRGFSNMRWDNDRVNLANKFAREVNEMPGGRNDLNFRAMAKFSADFQRETTKAGLKREDSTFERGKTDGLNSSDIPIEAIRMIMIDDIYPKNDRISSDFVRESAKFIETAAYKSKQPSYSR